MKKTIYILILIMMLFSYVKLNGETKSNINDSELVENSLLGNFYTYIEGTITWQDSDNNVHYGTNIRVELYIGDVLTYYTYTNETGSYNFDIYYDNYYDDVKCFLVSENEQFIIKNSYFIEEGQEYDPDTLETYKLKIYENLLKDHNLNYSVNYLIQNYANIGSELDLYECENRAFILQQCLNLGVRYINKLNDNGIGNEIITVIFPQKEKNGILTSFCNSITTDVHIIYNDANDWDVILHELAHSIMLKLEFGNLLNYIRSYKNDNYIINVLEKKKENLYSEVEKYYYYMEISKLNFFEGWATYFSITCQLEMNASEMNIPNVGDLYYTDTEDLNMNINVQEAYYLENGEKKYIKFGDANEVNIASILLNLYLDNPTFDSLSYDHIALWDILKLKKPQTFNDFIKNFYSENMLQNIELSNLLTYNGFNTSITDVSINSTGGLDISWTKGGSVELAYNNYSIIISNSLGEIIYTKNTTSNNYEIEKNELDRLIDINGKLYIFIASKMLDYEYYEALIVDTYYSNTYVLEKEFNVYYTIDINNDNLNTPIIFPINNKSIIELNNELRENVYNFIINASSEFSIILYNEELNACLDINSHISQGQNEVNISTYIDNEVKYMLIIFNSNNNNNEIKFNLFEINNYVSLCESYNVNEIYKVNKNKYKTSLLFNNIQESGYYVINLETQSNNLIEEVRVDNINGNESSEETSIYHTSSNSSTLITYMEYNQQYNIYISMNVNDNLILTITNIDCEQELTFLETEIRSEKIFNISLSQDNNGDSVKLINVLKPIRVKLIVEEDLLNESDNIFIIEKQILNEDYVCIGLENVVTITNDINNTYVNLNIGKYYIGIFSCINSESWNISMERIIDNDTDYDSFIIDPGNGWKNGSQIDILEKNSEEKSYNSNIINEGFTRIIYIDNMKAPSPSRLDYVWYSSNENVASVTSFGTVLAKNVSNRQTVMIYAIYKNDPSIILVKSFLIDPYNGENIIIQKNINVGINQLVTINMESELPFNFLQYYIWTSSNMNVASVDQFGRINGIGEGTCVITGLYIYNPNVLVNIYVTVS